MSNRINEVVTHIKDSERITYRQIAERCKISEQTLHSARKRESMGKIHIDVFLKIAHGLGMTAEELYYGEERPIAYADEREADIHRIWGELDEERRGRLHNTAQDMELAKSNEGSAVLAQEVAE